MYVIGNFLHILRRRLADDKSLNEAFKSVPGNAKYTSKTIQNQLLDAIKTLIRTRIVDRVNAAGKWCLLGDESPDRQKRELMVLAARYIDFEDGCFVLKEDPFAVVDAYNSARNISSDPEGSTAEMKLDAKTLSKVILQEIASANLQIDNCVAQGYDGASTMSGVNNGVAAEILKISPLAYYFHCVSHVTNLSCSKCTVVPIVRNAHAVMESIINHLNVTPKRSNLFKAIAKKHKLSDKLIKLCTTRFVERHQSVLRFCEIILVVWKTLSAMENWDDREASTKSFNLRVCLEKTETIVGLLCLKEISGLMRPLSVMLQQRGCDISRSLDQF